MRLEILFLLVVTVADVISATWPKITFPVKLLEPDLQAISQYYDKMDTLMASVQWPDSISFSIEMTKHAPSNEFHLRVHGTFSITNMAIMTSIYDGLYYRNGAICIKKDAKAPCRKISPDTKVTYTPPTTVSTITATTLSIKYFSLKELMEAIEPFYFNHKKYVDEVLTHHPATFLATVPDTVGHFVEYTYMGDDNENTLADGKLRVLLGSGKKGKLVLTNNTEAYRLVFDQNNHIFKVPENFNIHSKPLDNVFGVRMATKGFMAEVHRDAVNMLNSEDLIYGRPIEKQHSMFVRDLMQKVKTVEPRHIDSAAILDSQSGARPTSMKFQVHGQVLIKSVNYNQNGRIDYNCPYTIEYANKGRQFLFKDRWVNKIYTNDLKLWADEEEGPVPAQKETVSLMY